MCQVVSRDLVTHPLPEQAATEDDDDEDDSDDDEEEDEVEDDDEEKQQKPPKKKEKKIMMSMTARTLCALIPTMQKNYKQQALTMIREKLTFQDPSTVLSLAQHNEYFPLHN